MSPSVWRLALRGLAREWRAGELHLLGLALVVAVAGVTAVGFFTDRVDRALQGRAAEFLAADLVLDSSEPVPAAWVAEAHRLGLETARTLEMPTMLEADGRLVLAELKAVERSYPLRGRLEVEAPTPKAGPPGRGEIWLAPRLAAQLGLALDDPVRVGRIELRVTGLLTREPDRGGRLFSIAPRALMAFADIEATGLIQPGSRVRRHLLLAGAEVAAWRAWVAGCLRSGDALRGLEDARPELRQALERARRFLGLAALAALVLSGLAAALAAHHYAALQVDAVALMRCLGAGAGLILRLYLARMALLALVAGLLGLGLGYLAQAGIAWILGDALPAGLPLPSVWPAAAGLGVAAATLTGFVLPPLWGLGSVPPLRVLRRDLTHRGVGPGMRYLAGFAALAGLAWWQAGDARLAGVALVGILGSGLVLAGLGWVSILALDRLRGHLAGAAAWRFGLAAIARRRTGSLWLVTAVGIGVLALSLLGSVRSDLIAAWAARIPADAPNRFLINILPVEREAVAAELEALGIFGVRLYPMVRGRLTALGGRPLRLADYAPGRPRRLAGREHNLSWSADLPPGNRILAGRWWSPEDGGGVRFSVESGLAHALGIGLGDLLTFHIAGRSLSGRVTSLRAVEWDSLRANFFFLASPGALDGLPATWMTSIHLPEDGEGALTDLVRRHPAITVLDVGAVLARVRELLGQAAAVVRYVFLFSLAAGLLVLAAAILASLDERRREMAVLRVLGAGRRQLLGGLAVEFAVLGGIAGLAGALGAGALGVWLAGSVLGLDYTPGPVLPLMGAAAGAAMVALAGLAGTWRLVRVPPMAVLRG